LTGYDLDGIPKIGELELQVIRHADQNGVRRWTTSVLWIQVDEIQDQFTSVLGGMKDVANEALENPEKVTEYKILDKYHTAIIKDRGASLSSDDLDELGRALVSLTSERHREVGGARQLAVLNGGRVSRVTQPGFPPLRRPFQMMIMTGSLIQYPPFPSPPPILIRGNPVRFYDSVTFVGQASEPIKRGHMSLDRGIFVNCTFKNMVLWYDGGSIYFDSTNKAVDSQLAYAPHASEHPELARQLQANFDLATKSSGDH
jgi:hypothetical protein